MNEFLTNLSSGHTILWALFIIGVISASAVALHLFWTVVLWSVDTLRRHSPKDSEDHR